MGGETGGCEAEGPRTRVSDCARALASRVEWLAEPCDSLLLQMHVQTQPEGIAACTSKDVTCPAQTPL